MKHPFFKTKIERANRKFNLADPKERLAYFELKAGPEINKLKTYLKRNTFIAYFLGKKNSGKGTYSKMFAEIVGSEKIAHFSIGDMIREIDKELEDKKKKKELIEFLEKNYRGWISTTKEIITILEKRSTETLLPTDLILTLVKREIGRSKKKTLFIDGFPRDLDQINFSLFFRDLIGYRDDPDIFILIDVPETVIDERIKYRRVCPSCQTSRNFKLLPTSKIEYDSEKKQFYLLCDNPQCLGTQASGASAAWKMNASRSSPSRAASLVRLLPKEGDEKGIGPIKTRLKKDEELMARAFSLYGIPKILLRNSLPVKLAKKYVDDYEITPEYIFQLDKKEGTVKVKEKPWIVSDDQGAECVSLLAPPVVVSLIKQTVAVLGL